MTKILTVVTVLLIIIAVAACGDTNTESVTGPSFTEASDSIPTNPQDSLGGYAIAN